MDGTAAVLVGWFRVDRAVGQDVHAWYCHEHLTERLGVPGIHRGRYLQAGDGEILTLLEARTTRAFVSSEYLALLDDPTPWTRKILPGITASERTVARTMLDIGHACGAEVVVSRLRGGTLALARELCGSLYGRQDVLRAQVLEPDSSTTGAKECTVEGREAPSRTTEDLLLLLDLAGPERRHSALATLAASGLASRPGPRGYVLRAVMTEPWQ